MHRSTRAAVPGWLSPSGAAALVTWVTLPLAAKDPYEPVRLEYTSAAGCPDRATFEARVLARTARALFVEAARDVRTFEVTVEAGAYPVGRLTVRRAGVVEGTRDVHADTCSDVADALALAAALAIDPSLSAATAHPTPPSLSGPGPEPSVSTGTSPTAGISFGAPLENPAPDSRAPPPSSPPDRPRPAPPSPSSPAPHPNPVAHTFFVGVQAVATTGASPGTLVGASPFVGWRSNRASVVAPSVSLSFLHAASGTLPVEGGAASFAWTVGRVGGCPLSWPTGPARLMGCLSVEAGALEATGSQVPSPLTRRTGWLAAGPLVRGEWDLRPTTLFVGAQAAVMLRVTADRFYFPQGNSTVYQVPIDGFEGAVGLGVHFL